jgi:hypothetical protein
MRYRLRTLLIVLGFIPLLIWPAVFLADIMGLAAPRTGHEPQLTITLFTAFLVGSMAYPLVYCPCALVSESIDQKSKRLALALSVVPLVYLFVVVLLFLSCGWAEEDSIREKEKRVEKYGKPTSSSITPN